MPDAWSPEEALRIAERSGMATLGGHHWKVIASVREEAARCGCSPTLRRIEKLTGFGSVELHQLFPGDTASLIARLAGFEAPPSGGASSRSHGHKENRGCS